jgi:hypothetical protein
MQATTCFHDVVPYPVSGGVSSLPRGVFWGWTLVTSCRETPWKPRSASRLLPGGKGAPAHSATRFSDALPASGGARSLRARSRGARGGGGAWDTAAGRSHRLVALRERSGTGSDVQGHHAHTAGGGAAVRRLRLAHRGQRGGGAGWKPGVVGSGGMQHAMPEVNPRMRRRWRPPTALTWHVLNRVLCHLRPQAPPCVRPRRPGTLVIRPGTSAGTGVAITGAVLPRGRARACNMWQPRGQCWRSSPRQRPYTPGTLGHLVIPWQSHLPPR